MKKIKKGLILTLALFVGITFSSFVTTDDVHAAVKTPGKVTLSSVETVSSSQIKITWKKAANSPTGYEVYRGSSKIGTTKNLSFTNSGLKAGTTYSYKVRGYKNYTQKQYYNTKSKKWVTKKPRAKYWKGKKTRKVAKYKYGKFSSVKSAKTSPLTAAKTATPKIPGEKDTAETHAKAADVTTDIPKEVTVAAPAVSNADDPEKIKQTSAKASTPAIGISDIQNLTVKATSRNVQLSWTAQTSATGYQVFRTDKETETPQLIFNSENSKFYDIEGISAEKTYYYQVRAFQTINNATYYGKKTEIKSAAVPASFADSEHINITDTGITLSWDAPQLTTAQKEEAILADLNKEYPEIEGTWTVTSCQYIYPVSRDGSLKATVTDTSWIDKNVVDENIYSYKVKKGLKYKAEAFDSATGENISKSGDIILSSETYDNIYFEKGAEGFDNTEVESGTIKLAPPTGFSAIGNFNNVSLSWDVNVEVKGYKIYRDGSLIKTIDNCATCTYKDTDVAQQTQYTYTIKSVNEKGGVSSTAASLSIKTPSKPSFLPPAGFTAKATYNSVDLKWTANPVVDSYRIYRNETLIATLNADETEYIDKAAIVKPETKYTYSACSVKGTDQSIKTTLSITTPKTPVLLPPTKVTATGNFNNVALYWTENEAADSYNIYRNNVKIANIPATETGYLDINLSPRTLYTYSISSEVDSKESEKVVLKIATPAKPDVIFDELKNVTLPYGSTTIHLGQKWTSTLKSQLAAGASGTESVTRTGFICKTLADPNTHMNKASYIFNEDIYMFDTGDYDKFLVVYVADGQIIKWTTNMSNMGSENGTALTRGATGLPSHGQATMKNRLSSGAWWYNGISYNGVFIGGFQVEALGVSNSWPRDIAGEKRVGMHFINAYRYLLGSQPLSYSDGLDGGTNIYKGTYTNSNGKEYTDSRYGAQPFAETNSMSKRCTHSTETCTEGPLAGQGSGTRNMIQFKAIGFSYYGENIGTGALGEGCLTVYADSVLHLQAIYNPEFTKIGIGFGDMPYAVHAEQFAR